MRNETVCFAKLRKDLGRKIQAWVHRAPQKAVCSLSY